MSLDFVHLHNHSQYSTLDGLGDVVDYVTRAKELNQPALSLTEHGHLSSAPLLYWECHKQGIEPILGTEAYYVTDLSEKEESKRYHVIFLAKGEKGYRTLCELSTESHRNFYRKPLLDKHILKGLGKDAQHLVVLSGCAASIISRLLMEEEYEEAIEEAGWWKKHFFNFYIEIQNHGTEDDRTLIRRSLRLAKKLSLPFVITNDPHYVHKGDRDTHDTLLAIQTASDIDDPNRMRFPGKGYHLRSAKEIASLFPFVTAKKGMTASIRIAESCRVRIPEWDSRSWLVPSLPGVKDPYATLKSYVSKGLKEKGVSKDSKYVDRAKEELKIIKDTGISDFLLITRDCIQWAKKQDIPVGVGRGSFGGSLIGYLIGAHNVDSVRYGLMFERFLNPARPRMPDIDTDFGKDRRDELFAYVIDKYGENNVMNIAAFQTLKVRSAFQSLAKAYGISYAESVSISKTLPYDEDPLDTIPAEITETYPDLADRLSKLVGIIRAVSTHPAGLIITDDSINIRGMVPEMWIASTKKWVAQYDLEAISKMGFLKQDFLGLRTLDTIKECVDLIRDTTGEEVDPDSWIPDEEKDDKGVYAMLAEGKTAGIFQMEGKAVASGIKAIGPTQFSDLAACVALYRAGSIISGFPDKFLENRKKKQIRYPHPSLRPILEETHGTLIYQEQAMLIARTLAKFSMEEEDDLKEAMGKKKSDLMASLRSRFVKGCVGNEINKETAIYIWDRMIAPTALYAFNQAHSVSYGITGYQTSRLKYLYPDQFYTALIRTVTDKEKRKTYLQEATESGMKIVPPDVNESDHKATLNLRKRTIRFGLEDITGVGEKQAEKIVSKRPKKGYKFIDEVGHAAKNEGVMKALLDAGAFACLGEPIDMSKAEKVLDWQFRDRMIRYRQRFENRVIHPNDKNGKVWVIGEITNIEKKKTRNGDYYLTWTIRWSPSTAYIVRLWSGTEDLWKLATGTIVSVRGDYERKWQNISISDEGQVKVIRRAS